MTTLLSDILAPYALHESAIINDTLVSKGVLAGK